MNDNIKEMIVLLLHVQWNFSIDIEVTILHIWPVLTWIKHGNTIQCNGHITRVIQE